MNTQSVVAFTAPSAAEATLVARFTQDPHEVQQAFALRYRVFSAALGINSENSDGIDRDHFDDVCLHLVVKDILNNRIVGYSRVLTNELAERAGSFYSATEFDLSNIILPHKTYMEIGRTCVDPDFRSGAVIGLLWSVITQYMTNNHIDYLMGCASIPLQDGESRAVAAINYLREHHFTDPSLRATPKYPMPPNNTTSSNKALVPPLIRAYMRIGFKICGEPCVDREFNVVDALILMASGDMNQRYLKHFSRQED